MELKLCPFCGGKAKIIHGRPFEQKKGKRMAFVRCKTCKVKTQTYIQLPYMSWEDVDRLAIEAWEMRAGNG